MDVPNNTHKAVVDLSLQIYLRLIPEMIYDDTQPHEIANIAYECAKAYYLTVPSLVKKDIESGNTA